jgi:hypothetical protein
MVWHGGRKIIAAVRSDIGWSLRAVEFEHRDCSGKGDPRRTSRRSNSRLRSDVSFTIEQGEKTLNNITDLPLPQNASLAQLRFATLASLEPRHSNRSVLAKTFDGILSGETSPKDRERLAHHRAVLAGERLPEHCRD